MFDSLLFPRFRHLWESDSEGVELTQKVEALIAQRTRGLMACPSSAPLNELAPVLPLFRHIFDSRHQPRPDDPFEFYRLYANAICRLQPLVDAAKWPRWLLLERALSNSSATGDLLTAALAMRTQIEALSDLLMLQAYERQLPKFCELDSPFLVTTADCSRIRDHATLLWSRFLPELELLDREGQIQQSEMPKNIEPRPNLVSAFTELNDYVHPNYGSHIQAVWPEEARAVVVLLKSFVAIYSTFLDLDWLRQPSGFCEPAELPEHTTNWIQTEFFVEKTLPHICRTLRDRHNYSEHWRVESKFLSVFPDKLVLERERWDSLWAVCSSDSQESSLDLLRTICAAFTPSDILLSTKEVFFFPKQEAGLGLPATAEDWLLLLGLRRHAVALERTVSALGDQNAFPTAPPYDKWIDFLKTALEFSVMVAIYKMKLMRVAVMRNLNESNHFGAILCARSMMESYAVAHWLSSKFRGEWGKIENAAGGALDLPLLLGNLESDVGRFLAGTKRTEEAETLWRSRWRATDRARHVNLETAVEKAFQGEGELMFLYKWFCRVIHGDRLTGGDLLEPGAEQIAEKQFAKAVKVIAYFEDPRVILSLYRVMLPTIARVAHPQGIRAAESVEEIRITAQKGTVRGLTFKVGRDVFGSGSESDPFYFRLELPYHESFNAYLEQKDIRGYVRSVWLSQGYRGDQVKTKDGRVIFFRT